MKLLLTQSGFGAGGTEKIVAMIATHRAGLGDEVHVAAMTCPEAGSYFAYPPEVKLHVLDASGGPGGARQILRRVRALRGVINALAPDEILSFLTKINVLTLVAAAGSGRPVIVSERNNPLAQSAHPLWLRAQNALMPRAAAIVMQTDRARSDLPAQLHRHAVVIPNPCAPLAGHVPKPAGDSDTGTVRLVAVGRLDRQKGFDLLIEAMAAVHVRHPNARLTIFGEGPERDALESQCQRLGLAGVVELPGVTLQPGAWILDAEVLVMPSRFEGFPNVLAEALVQGVPAVAFDCAYGPRELIEDGENGLLVPEGDVPGLAEALDCLIACPDLRAQMAAAAPRQRARLAPDRILRHWDALIVGEARRARLIPRDDIGGGCDARQQG